MAVLLLWGSPSARQHRASAVRQQLLKEVLTTLSFYGVATQHARLFCMAWFRICRQVLVEVLSSKARAVGAAELLRESMKCAANAWALGVALDGLDDWTLSQIRPDSVQAEVRVRLS
jgi:hypothetical protein